MAGTEMVPQGVPVWNPAFDITPAHLITAFITDGGIVKPPFSNGIAELVEAGRGRTGSSVANPMEES
jgi:methylthioribose-1-phosphate isomerase